MSEIKQLKRFIYSAMVTSGSGSQSFYIDAKNREEADKRAANNESDGMYADDSEVTDLGALEYEDETTVDDFGGFPLISREQSLIAQLEAAQKELSAANEKLSKPVVLPDVVVVNISGKYPIEVMYASQVKTFLKAAGFTVEG
ncbi:TPA: hypothetical protein PXN96_003848 [Yersinia enterocolitica]|nr:hypothetical protein [Yersinia enterocolitica]HDL7488836.1 hypothetical protein [Yersinia enterocolitica]